MSVSRFRICINFEAQILWRSAVASGQDFLSIEIATCPARNTTIRHSNADSSLLFREKTDDELISDLHVFHCLRKKGHAQSDGSMQLCCACDNGEAEIKIKSRTSDFWKKKCADGLALVFLPVAGGWVNASRNDRKTANRITATIATVG